MLISSSDNFWNERTSAVIQIYKPEKASPVLRLLPRYDIYEIKVIKLLGRADFGPLFTEDPPDPADATQEAAWVEDPARS